MSNDHNLNITVNHCPDGTLVDALSELLTNAFDANAASGCSDLPELKQSKSTIEIADAGTGLSRGSFVIGRNTQESVQPTVERFGRFGLGLKDAVAVLIRSGYHVLIHSQAGDCSFFVQASGIGVHTIWVRFLPASVTQGTRFVLNQEQPFKGHAPSPEAALKQVRDRFLAFSAQPPVLLFQSDLVDIFDSNQTHKKRCTFGLGPERKSVMFANGRAIVIQQPTRFGYHFKSLSVQMKTSINRDHQVRSMKFFDERILDAWRQAMVARGMQQHIAQLKRTAPTHEFGRIHKLGLLVWDEQCERLTGSPELSQHLDRQQTSPCTGALVPARAAASAAATDPTPVLGPDSVENPILLGGRVLVVGDGDFSFSAACAILASTDETFSLVASSYDSLQTVLKTYLSAPINLALLELAGCTCMHGLDARTLHQSSLTNSVLFDVIVFNFPSCGVERGPGLTRNRKLVRDFLSSAARLLVTTGEIWITLRGVQAVEWELRESCEAAGLMVTKIRAFRPSLFPGYAPKRGAQDTSFPIAGSRIHILRRSSSTKRDRKNADLASTDSSEPNHDCPTSKKRTRKKANLSSSAYSK
eukprot:TRINITY_DN43953_c0_g1_i1.p1 TRINITY_DN43953_c0_g1~~TRINITY_DN43953_c0_g1_i1.p1  ORF type:complete len:586 (+),score=49.60 TRINITY_DN43953_c0_g1_i1:95-1852(+)